MACLDRKKYPDMQNGSSIHSPSAKNQVSIPLPSEWNRSAPSTVDPGGPGFSSKGRNTLPGPRTPAMLGCCGAARTVHPWTCPASSEFLISVFIPRFGSSAIHLCWASLSLPGHLSSEQHAACQSTTAVFYHQEQQTRNQNDRRLAQVASWRRLRVNYLAFSIYKMKDWSRWFAPFYWLKLFEALRKTNTLIGLRVQTWLRYPHVLKGPKVSWNKGKNTQPQHSARRRRSFCLQMTLKDL